MSILRFAAIFFSTMSPAHVERALALVRAEARNSSGVRLFCTAGVHPHDAKTCNDGTLPALLAALAAPECVAVGECGLDFDRMFSPRETQLLWFERQVALAVQVE